MKEKFKTLNNFPRSKLPELIKNSNNLVGIELGVAKGAFSKKMVESKKFSFFFGVDKYSDHHNTQEYLQAIKNVGIYSNYKLIKSTFDEALELFEDNFFDFIYIDGYAHNGQLGGDTIARWYPKLKVNGVICGDDFDDKFPLVKQAVNYLSNEYDLEILLTDQNAEEDGHDFSSWAHVCQKKLSLSVKQEMIRKSKIYDFYYRNKIKFKKFFEKIILLLRNFKKIIINKS
jgi:hypothetical protein